MYLTRAQNPAEVQRYSHLRPAGILGPRRCEEQSPDGHYTCTRPNAHEPPHVAHTFFRQVLAVWDHAPREADPLSEALDHTLVLDYKAEAIASPIVKGSDACAALLLSRLGTSIVADPHHERRTQLARDFAFAFCLLTDRLAAAHLPGTVRDLFVARLALFVARNLPGEPTPGHATALVQRLSRWRSAHRPVDNLEFVRLWATDLPTRHVGLPPQQLTTLAAQMALLEWKALETDVGLDLRLLDSLLHRREPQRPAGPATHTLPPCPRCSQSRTGMLLCSPCEQLAWRVAEAVADAINLTADSVSGLSEANAAEAADRLGHIHREVLLLFYSLTLQLQELRTLPPETREVLSGWLRAVVITNILLPIEPLGDGAPKFVKDAAVKRLGNLIDERTQQYQSAAEQAFGECARLAQPHFGIDPKDAQSLGNIALMFSRAWSAIADHVVATIRPLGAGAG